MRTYAPAENPYRTLMVDLTHRCNMACANCYIPNRDVPDMDVGRLRGLLEELPRRTEIRLVGAEPTMRRDLPRIIEMVRKTGHNPYLISNGLRLAQASYVRALCNAGLRRVYISLNGADRDDWYDHIDNLRCAEKKVRALQNVADNRMLIGTGTILVRGVNEGAVERVIGMVRGSGASYVVMRFRNVGAIGRFDRAAEAANLSLDEMRGLVATALDRPASRLQPHLDRHTVNESAVRWFPVDEDRGHAIGRWIKLTDWTVNESGIVDAGSRRRGRVTPDFRIAPFFEHVKANEGGY